MSVGYGRQARQNWLHGILATVFCFAFLASMPGLYRKKCKACQRAEGAGTTASAHERE